MTSLFVFNENVLPRRHDKYGIVITAIANSLPKPDRHFDVMHLAINKRLDDAAIKKYEPVKISSRIKLLDCKSRKFLRKIFAVHPRQCIAAASQCFANDNSSGLRYRLKAF